MIGIGRAAAGVTADFTNVAAGIASLRYLQSVGVAAVERHEQRDAGDDAALGILKK